MKKNKETERREKRGIGAKVLLGPVLVVLAMVVAYALISGGVLQGLWGIDASFLLLPVLAGLAVTLVSQFIGALLAGTLVPAIRMALHWFALGLFLYLLLPSPEVPAVIRPAALPLFLLFLLIAVYTPVANLTKGLPLLTVAAKSVALLFAGLVVGFLFLSVLPSWRGIQLPIVFFCGFAFSAVFLLLSTLSFSKNPYVSTVGRWFRRLVVSMFFLGAFLALYFTWLRAPATTILGGWLPIAEWGTVCAMCGIGFALLRSSVRRKTGPVSYATWAKHLQVVEAKEDRDVVDVSRLVRDFVERGSKGGLLVHMISDASSNGVPRDRILEAVEKMVDHQDAPIPRVATRWEMERVMEENREARKKLLENTIKKLREI
jgi:hypothetical protein